MSVALNGIGPARGPGVVAALMRRNALANVRLNRQVLAACVVLRREVVADCVTDPGIGICGNVRIIMRRAGYDTYGYANLLALFFPTWPDYSGDVAYPVPHPDPLTRRFTAADAYDSKFLRHWRGRYGELRVSLLNYIIASLEEVA